MEKYNEIQKDIPISNRPNAKYIELAKQMDVGDSILFKTVNLLTTEYGGKHNVYCR
jgi:transposase-like protein